MTPAPDQLVLRRPDDWHVHLRDDVMLEQVLPATARQFARAIVMPNLRPPVTTVDAAIAYRQRIEAALPQGMAFTPLMTAYLTDDISPDELERGHREGVFTAAKLYPANATTNSAAGVSDLTCISAVLERMQAIDMPLLIHGEVTDPDIDIFDREAVFIERHLIPLRRQFPQLRVVFEHITTEQAAQFVADDDPLMAATITPTICTSTATPCFKAVCVAILLLAGGQARAPSLGLAPSGHQWQPLLFLGTDSAPTPARGQGNQLRLRWHLQRALCAGELSGGV